MPCLVCEGTPGYYPVIDSRGKHLYDIRCPECDGTGETYEEFTERRQAEQDRARYEAAMAETRAAIVDGRREAAETGTGSGSADQRGDAEGGNRPNPSIALVIP